MGENEKNVTEAGDVGMEPSNSGDNPMQVGSGIPMKGSETIGKKADVWTSPADSNDNPIQVGPGMPMEGSEAVGEEAYYVGMQPVASNYIFAQVRPIVPMTDSEVPQQSKAVDLDCEPGGVEAELPEEISSSEHSDTEAKQSLKCPVKECNKVFNRKDRLKHHVMLHEHNVREYPFLFVMEAAWNHDVQD